MLLAWIANARRFAHLYVSRIPNRSHTMLAILTTPACSCTDTCSPRPVLSGTLLPKLHSLIYCLLLQRRRSRCKSLREPCVLCGYHRITSPIMATFPQCRTRRMRVTRIRTITAPYRHSHVLRERGGVGCLRQIDQRA
jgi:hypothetical protein